MKGNTVDRTTRTHSPSDEGKTFTDTYGRVYVYTSNGLIY